MQLSEQDLKGLQCHHTEGESSLSHTIERAICFLEGLLFFWFAALSGRMQHLTVLAKMTLCSRCLVTLIDMSGPEHDLKRL